MPAGLSITIKDKGLFYLGLLNVVLRDALFTKTSLEILANYQLMSSPMEQDEIYTSVGFQCNY